MQHALPLEGVRIVDFSRLLPGPWSTQTLGDLGADVIKVEQPGVGDYGRFNPPDYRSMGVYFNSVNRNKRSIALDLTRPEGAEVARRLLESADIVVESFRPGVTEKLKIDYQTVSSFNPAVIYCSITGFGQTGSHAKVPAHDMAIQAMTGVMGMNPETPGAPSNPGFQAGDYAPAAYAVTGILGAYINRLKTGAGCHLDIAMYDALFVWCNIGLSGALARLGGFEGKPEIEVWGANPRYAAYPTRDGKSVVVCLLETRTWVEFCRLIGREDLLYESESYADRHTHHGEHKIRFREAITALCAAHDRDALVEWMMKANIPVVPVLAPDEVVNSEIARERGLIEWIDHPSEGRIPQLVNPLTHAGFIDPHRHPAPALDEHADEVLTELGYGPADVARLRAAMQGDG
ncbi:MAG: CoA transferase [Myxococcales bacterium]|nr:CoA transferase [Myxococcales bacterium]